MTENIHAADRFIKPIILLKADVDGDNNELGRQSKCVHFAITKWNIRVFYLIYSNVFQHK